MSAGVPQLRRLLASETKKHFVVGLACCIVATAYARFSYRQNRFDNYQRFHNNYDPKADYERMKAAGILTAFKSE